MSVEREPSMRRGQVVEPSQRWGGWRVLFPATTAVGDEAVAEAGWQPDRPGDYCGRCGATVAEAAVTIEGCPHCRRRRIAWHNLWRLGAYQPPLSNWVIALKFQRAWGWGDWFGDQLARRTPDHERAVVVPVPLHWRRRFRRGYDQAGLIARGFAARKGIEVAPLLRRRRATAAQTSLTNRETRLRNVRNAFAMKRVDLTGWTVWLVDDVSTSGSTARACALLLRRAGAERVNLAVAAVADPHHADFQHT